MQDYRLRLFSILSFLTAIGILVIHGMLIAQTSSLATALQGSWTVVAAQHEGKPMEGLNGGVLTVTGERFEIHTAGGSELKGKLRWDTDKTPQEMDLQHDSGMLWLAIFEVQGDVFKLNYLDSSTKEKRPQSFRTATGSEASLVVLKRTSK